MTPQEGLAHLAALSPSSIKMGLGRVVIALGKLGNPQTRFPALHVAGTNGKGSTCAIAASCLRQRYRTGLYTSPHLVRPNERIQLDGVEIDDDTFGRRIVEVLEVLGVDHELTYFEFGTIVAFWHFAREAVDIAVVETGLGGRLDATTACVPEVTCVTPVDFDHMEYLGTSLAQIAAEKAGIFKPGVPVVLAAQNPEALAVLDRPGAKLEGRDFQRVPSSELPLRGAHQQQNLAVALACLDALTRFPLSAEERARGVSQARWPGRLEALPGEPLVVLDGAHNTAGVEALLRALDEVYPGRPVHLVFGVFTDKDSAPMMRLLFPRVAALYLTPIDSPRSKPPDSYAALARELNAEVTVCASATHALELARARVPPGGVVVVAGSLFLVGQLRAALT